MVGKSKRGGGLAVIHGRRRNLPPDGGSCPAFYLVHATCARGSTRKVSLGSSTLCTEPCRHTTYYSSDSELQTLSNMLHTLDFLCLHVWHA